ASSANLPLMGTVGLTAEGEWKGNLAKSSFDASLQMQNLGMGAAKIFSIALPAISLGNVNLKVSNKQGKMELTEFQQGGGNFSVQAKGSVRLKQRFYSSTLDLCFKLKGDETFLKENPKLKTSMDLGTAVLHKDSDGFLHAPVKGPIRAMRPPRSPKPCKGL
ncbi:MAG: type II secretion system protein GspN, partial [Myxococcota bacterium]|nr:type II secretion system protein GspN [Myxococcota bacterium]